MPDDRAATIRMMLQPGETGWLFRLELRAEGAEQCVFLLLSPDAALDLSARITREAVRAQQLGGPV